MACAVVASEPLDLPDDAEVYVNLVEVLLADVVLSSEDAIAVELCRAHRLAVPAGRTAYGPVEWVVWPSDPYKPDPGRPDPDKRWFALRVQLAPQPEEPTT